jgi:hypothetical protein
MSDRPPKQIRWAPQQAESRPTVVGVCQKLGIAISFNRWEKQ